MKERARESKRSWAAIPPWIIIGAVGILAPIFVYMTLENIHRQREYAIRLLKEKGAALISSFEAGARTGTGMGWDYFQLQKLLMETAQQPDIDYLIVTDIHGIVLAHSDPSLIGEIYGRNLNLEGIFRRKRPEWRQVPNQAGADTFEVFRGLALVRQDILGFQSGGTPDMLSSLTAREAGNTAVIFVGLNMGPIEAAREETTRHTVLMAVILLLIGFSGIVSLFLAQSYRSVKSSLSRIKAFSDMLVENMPVGLLAIDDQGRITSFNQAAESIFQLSHRQTIGEKADNLLPGPFRSLLRQAQDDIGSLAIGKGIIEREIEYLSEDGRCVPLEVIGTALEDDKGSFLGYVILFRDMSEVQELKKEVARSQRLASLGSLAAGIAHEIRNPLSSIKGFATYFKERYRNNLEDQKTADIMVQEVERLNRAIGQLLEFARPMNLSAQWTSPQTLVLDTLRMIEGEAREKNIAIEVDLPSGIGEIMVDTDRIKQVLLNLYLNATGAMEDGGTLSVALSRMDAATVRLDISDTGAGIDSRDLPHIFDPYFTTKPSGTGLGLAIVHKIIEAHHGKVRVESESGRGTTISVFFPLSPEDKTSKEIR